MEYSNCTMISIRFITLNLMFDGSTTFFFFSQAFCCAEFHVGCVVTAPAPAPAAMPYDCHAGYSNWRLVTVGKCQDFFQQILGKFERPQKTYK